MAIREIISSYGSPIIAGITPYSVVRVDPYAEIRASDWPPYIEDARLQKLRDFTALLENRPAEVFADLALAESQSSKILLAAALPELLATVWADAVWTDPPTIELPSTTADDRWAAIDTANDWTEIGAWESVFATAGWGTSILYLTRDPERQERLGLDSDVKITEIDPAIFFPVLRGRSSREFESVVLAWTEDRSDPGSDRVNHWHVRELHEVIAGQYTITYQERRAEGAAARNAFQTTGEERPEGVDFLPFVDMHAKRWRGRYWGVGELERNLSLFDDVDNTLSNVAEILEYHGKPMLQVPASVIYGGTLTKGADKTLGIRRPDEATIARYITFDGQLATQMASLDKTIELILLTAEIPRAYFGTGNDAAPASGVAYKLQLQNFLKKAARYQRAESQRSRTLIPMALRLDGMAGDGAALMPKITHGSPLPADDEQDARIEQGLYAAGMTSLELSLRKLRRVPSDEIDDEIARINEDKEDAIGRLPAPLAANAVGSEAPVGGGNSSDDPNGGDGPAA